MLLKQAKHVKGRYEYDIGTNRELRIECSVSGYPAPSFSWKKGRKAISGRGQVQYRENEDVAELVISDFQLDDAGTYVCEADNEAGIEREEVQVFVVAGKIVDGGFLDSQLRSGICVGDQAFNFSLPDVNAAIRIPKAGGTSSNQEDMSWTEIDPSGRLTNYDPDDSWFEEPEEEDHLISRGRRHQECSGYVDVSRLKSRMRDRLDRSVVGNGDERTAVLDTQTWPQSAAGVIYFTLRFATNSTH